jgi:hypothetical protein
MHSWLPSCVDSFSENKPERVSKLHNSEKLARSLCDSGLIATIVRLLSKQHKPPDGTAGSAFQLAKSGLFCRSSSPQHSGSEIDAPNSLDQTDDITIVAAGGTTAVSHSNEVQNPRSRIGDGVEHGPIKSLSCRRSIPSTLFDDRFAGS